MLFIFTSFVVSSLLQSVQADTCFVAGPYVLHVDQSSAQIVWVTPAGTKAGQVVLESAAGDHIQNLTAELSTPLFLDNNLGNPGERDELRHLVRIEDLKPYSRYYYSVDCGDDGSVREGTFRTAPVRGETENFEFVIVADGHADRRNYSRVAVPVGERQPDFVIHAGDLTGGWGADWDRWLPYFEKARPYHEASVLIPVNGGHDLRPNRNFRAFFAFNDPEGDPEYEDEAPTWFSMSYGNADFFFLDYDHSLPEQLQWLEQVLAESEATWKIISMHRFRGNVGSRGHIFTSYYYDLALLAHEYNVDLLVYGHDHIYERKLPITMNGSKPVHFICLNSNGHFRAIRPSPVIAGGIGQQEYMYAHFSIYDNQLRMKALNHEGSVIDSLNLIKDALGMYQPEIMDQAIELKLARKLWHIYTGQSYVEIDRYERRDIRGEIPTLLMAGKPAVLKLNTGYSGTHERDVSRFPIGSEFIIYEQNEPGSWQTKKQVIEITGDTVEVELIAPDNLTVNNGNLDPVLELMVNLRINGREFDPVRIRPDIDNVKTVGEVQLMHPTDLSTVSIQPHFNWEPVPIDVEYQTQLTKSNFRSEENIIFDSTLTDSEFILPNNLDPGESYRWSKTFLIHSTRQQTSATVFMNSLMTPSR